VAALQRAVKCKYHVFQRRRGIAVAYKSQQTSAARVRLIHLKLRFRFDIKLQEKIFAIPIIMKETKKEKYYLYRTGYFAVRRSRQDSAFSRISRNSELIKRSDFFFLVRVVCNADAQSVRQIGH